MNMENNSSAIAQKYFFKKDLAFGKRFKACLQLLQCCTKIEMQLRIALD